MPEKRMYTYEEAETLKGVMVICDEKTCDGKPCKGSHNKPHEYNDEEDFHSCGWPGHSGLCIPVENKV